MGLYEQVREQELVKHLDGRLPNHSLIEVVVQTRFKPQIIEGEDNREEIIRDFHNAVAKRVENLITEDDDFEQEVMEILQENAYLPDKTLEFTDLGEISIQIIPHSVVVKQKNGEKETKALPQGQKKLA